LYVTASKTRPICWRVGVGLAAKAAGARRFDGGGSSVVHAGTCKPSEGFFIHWRHHVPDRPRPLTHVFNRCTTSVPASWCIQYKSLFDIRLTEGWRGITRVDTLPALAVPPTFRAAP